MDIKKRFNNYLPVIIDCEMGGCDSRIHPLLEFAAFTITYEDKWVPSKTYYHCHIQAFEGAAFDPKAMEVTGIDPDHPFRGAIDEHTFTKQLSAYLSPLLKKHQCRKAVMAGHNIQFDQVFINACYERVDKKTPFHQYVCLDTATLSLIHLKENVLAQACRKAGIAFDPNQAHGALYDAKITTELFCHFLNR